MRKVNGDLPPRPALAVVPLHALEPTLLQQGLAAPVRRVHISASDEECLQERALVNGGRNGVDAPNLIAKHVRYLHGIDELQVLEHNRVIAEQIPLVGREGLWR
eukprot:Mycagemm_TRINITY_DN9417_c0_g1::TRINITY_DN9417_c0_g1_i1::g.3094::m.3094 type:complete len:104 gc:universal TRINITY_DN9417_c0_g1_i1:793-482(-)